MPVSWAVTRARVMPGPRRIEAACRALWLEAAGADTLPGSEAALPSLCCAAVVFLLL